MGNFGLTAHAGTTVADFLKWEKKAKDSYIEISISMATTIASQAAPKVASCIDDWYYAKPQSQSAKNDKLLATMKDYGEFHPSAFMLAYIESICGKFGDE